MTAKIKNRFPKKELNAWLRVHQTWDPHRMVESAWKFDEAGFSWMEYFRVRTKRNWVLSGNKTTL